MRTSRLLRCALNCCVAAAMLAGCGGRAGNGVVPSGGAPNSSLPHHKSFYYTGGEQDFTVPAGVRQLNVIARGARSAGSFAAHGGRVHAVIPVTPGEKLVVYVGGDASGTAGGFNGGGSGGSGGGKGGGGATDVREGGKSPGDRIVVSGGAGGAGQKVGTYRGGTGGKGGGETGGTGECVRNRGSGCNRFGGSPGDGGTQSAGGQGGDGGSCFTGSGTQGQSGALGIGGNGSAGGSGRSYSTYGGGGGGGGYYGGGGGGSGCTYDSRYYGAGGGGGGGGSSYVESRAKDVRMWQGWKNPAPNGLVVFSW
jgi:hypothetical protein